MSSFAPNQRRRLSELLGLRLPPGAVQAQPSSSEAPPDVADTALTLTSEELESRAQKIMGLPKTERTTEFHTLLQTNLAGPRVDAKALNPLIRSVGFLPKEDRLGSLITALGTISQWNAEDRPGLLETVAGEIQYLAPEDEDFRQPTDDQVMAFQRIISAIQTSVEPMTAARGVLVSVAEALEIVCLGEELYMFDGNLAEAVDTAVENLGDEEKAPIGQQLIRF